MNHPSGAKPPPLPLQRIDEVGVLKAVVQVFRARVVSGLVAALPIALTFFIVHWLYVTAVAALTPLITRVRFVMGSHGLSASYWERIVAPAVAVVLVLCSLYLLGLFVRTRVVRTVDWLLLHIPVIGTIFKAVSNVFQSLGTQLQGNQGFKRVVLVPFPNAEMRSLAFVTSTLRDESTGRSILCVCLLTGVMPPAGFTLFVPEDDVTNVDWSMNQTLQAILSGGITTPPVIPYFGGPHSTPHGPIIDPTGRPIAGPAPHPDDDPAALSDRRASP